MRGVKTFRLPCDLRCCGLGPRACFFNSRFGKERHSPHEEGSYAKNLQQCGAGVCMNCGTAVPYPVKQLSEFKDVSKEAKVRLAFLDFAKEHPISVTCRRFGTFRSTHYILQAEEEI